MKRLKASGVPFTLYRYRPGPKTEAYGLDAARALGVSPDRLFKTLVIHLGETHVAAALVPASRRLDLNAAAGILGAKRAVLAAPEAARRATGFVVGGISPLGHRKPMPVIMDESALDHETVYVSAGKRGLQMALNPKDLILICNARLGRISR